MSENTVNSDGVIIRTYEDVIKLRELHEEIRINTIDQVKFNIGRDITESSHKDTFLSKLIKSVKTISVPHGGPYGGSLRNCIAYGNAVGDIIHNEVRSSDGLEIVLRELWEQKLINNEIITTIIKRLQQRQECSMIKKGEKIKAKAKKRDKAEGKLISRDPSTIKSRFDKNLKKGDIVKCSSYGADGTYNEHYCIAVLDPKSGKLELERLSKDSLLKNYQSS